MRLTRVLRSSCILMLGAFVHGASQAQSFYSAGLKQQYETIKQPQLDKSVIQPSDIYPLIEQLRLNDKFAVTLAGQSFNQQPIYHIRTGNGATPVMMWTQMHGDEATATASVFDLINYISDPAHAEWVAGWQDKLTLHIIPMLNPDGAEIDSRFNAQGIDINRDAKRLQTPEGRVLHSKGKEIMPAFAFNLHDQNRFYGVGKTEKTAVISILAPAFNEAKDINDSRRDAMRLIGLFNESIQAQYPGHVGRYDDTYSYRAFGDYFSGQNVATTLIESGYYKDDMHRQIPRWLTFMALVQSIDAITNKTYEGSDTQAYHGIPMNKYNGVSDVLLRNVDVRGNYVVDISAAFDKQFEELRIREIGDIERGFGMFTYDMTGFETAEARVYELNHKLVLTEKGYRALLKQGYAAFGGDHALLDNQSGLPVVLSKETVLAPIPQRGERPTLLFSKNEEVVCAFIAGQMIQL